MCSGSVLCMIPFMEELDNLLGGCCKEFSALNNLGFVLVCENWDRYNFKGLLLRIVKSFILLI